MSRPTIEGTVAFCHLRTHGTYQGQPQDMYEITIAVTDDDARKLEAEGIKVKDYNGVKQRHFRTKNKLPIYGPDLTEWDGDEIPKGAIVKLIYQKSKTPFGNFGYSVYVQEGVQILSIGKKQIPAEFTAVSESDIDVEQFPLMDDEDDDEPPF